MAQTAINKAIKKGKKNKGSYVVLVMKCPATGCHGADRKATGWKHKGCKTMEMSQYGHVRCKDNHGNAFVNWRWACAKHRGDYRKADEQYFRASLQSVLAHGTFTNIDSEQWFLQLTINVCAQFGIEDNSSSDDD
eukprot:133810_1